MRCTLTGATCPQTTSCDCWLLDNISAYRIYQRYGALYIPLIQYILRISTWYDYFPGISSNFSAKIVPRSYPILSPIKSPHSNADDLKFCIDWVHVQSQSWNSNNFNGWTCCLIKLLVYRCFYHEGRQKNTGLSFCFYHIFIYPPVIIAMAGWNIPVVLVWWSSENGEICSSWRHGIFMTPQGKSNNIPHMLHVWYIYLHLP